jgi:hypothetical protein
MLCESAGTVEIGEELSCCLCGERPAAVVVGFGGHPTAMCFLCVAHWRSHTVPPLVLLSTERMP